MGNNVCKCPPVFSGPTCNRVIRPPWLSDQASDSPLSLGIRAPKPRLFRMPFIVSDNDDDTDDDKSKTMGEIEQSKIVNFLRNIAKRMDTPELEDLIKRNRIQEIPKNNLRYSKYRSYYDSKK